MELDNLLSFTAGKFGDYRRWIDDYLAGDDCKDLSTETKGNIRTLLEETIPS